MKFDKEYPATHSMETAWYAADEDGNVAIIKYDSNGPVPWELDDERVATLVFGHREDFDYGKDDVKNIHVNLSNDQIEDLIDKESPLEENRIYSWDTFVKIDKKLEKQFFEIICNEEIDCFTISKENGLYYIKGFDIKEYFGLEKIIKQGIIKKVYEMSDFRNNNEFKDGDVIFKKDFSSCPYFIYDEPYWTGHLLERMNIPVNPVKLEQFPGKFRQRVPRIPLKFKEVKNFQIAEYTPCDMWVVDEKHLNGCSYGLIPLTNGSKAYVLKSIDEIDFFKYCSEKGKYHCKDCPDVGICATAVNQVFTSKPTVITIVNPLRGLDYDKRVNTDLITLHSIILPYLYKIPIPLDDGDTFLEEVQGTISKRKVDEYFMKCHKYLDDMVNRFRPRVIIIGSDVRKTMHKVYKMTKTEITIGNETYPFFYEKMIEENRNEIERLAQLPYRGQTFRQVIPVEEMDKICEARDD